VGQYISCSWTPRKSVSGGRQVLCGVRIEFSTLMKLVTLIKMCLNSEWLETKRVSVVMLLKFSLECAIMKLK
jgi:hypothetical protein